MGDSVNLTVTKRDIKGAKPNALRAEGKVPAVIHDHGKDSHHISIEATELKRAYGEAGKHSAVEVDLDGKKMTALFKEVVYKPATNVPYHSVLQAVKANETVTAEIPLKLSDEIPAVRASLLVVTGVDSVEVEALPKDLVDEIIVDASGLVEAGDKITVEDIKAPAGITIMTDSEQLVAAVETPKDQVAEADAAAAEMAEQTGGGVPAEEPEAEAETEAPKE